MLTFQQYLDENGLHNLSKEDRKKAHLEYRTIYQREYRKRKYRSKKKRVEIHFEPDSFAALEDKAREHSLSVPGFIRSCIESQENQTFILRDREAMKAIELALRQCASSLTQIAFEARRSKTVALSELETLQKEIKALRGKIHRALALPPTAKDFLLLQQEQNPQFLSRLSGVLNNLLRNNNDT